MARTPIEGLRVIPSGPLPPDAAQVLRSHRVKEVIEQLKSSADMVIIDSSPLLSVTDPMLLAPLVDGVLLVVDASHTGRDTLKRGAETLSQAHPAVTGTVLNKVSSRAGSYYHYYHYYYYHYYYYGDSEDGAGQGRGGRVAALLSKVMRRKRGSGRRAGSIGAMRGAAGAILSRVRGVLRVRRGPVDDAHVTRDP